MIGSLPITSMLPTDLSTGSHGSTAYNEHLDDKIHGNSVEDVMSTPLSDSMTTVLDYSGSSKETFDDRGGSHMLAYVLVPLGSLVVIIILSFLVVFILKKSKLDKLRHHLMPLYNFEPGEEEGDWESELLEEDKEQQMALRIESPGSPAHCSQLKFHSEHSEL